METVAERRLRLNTVLVGCPLCHSRSFHDVVAARPHRNDIDGQYAVVQCVACRCTYLNPQLTPESLSAAYVLLQEDGKDGGVPRTYPARVNRLTQWWRNYSSYQIADAVTEGPVLDLGCNYGELLQELRTKGITASGVEFSPTAVGYCTKMGLNVEEARLEDLHIPSGRYRTVVLSHVLEHIADPVGLLTRVAASLPYNGTIVICVPNLTSPVRTIFGAHWHGWDPPFHLVHYDETSLRRVCELSGLSVVQVIKRVIPEDFRRSMLLWRGHKGRYLLFRILCIPATYILTLLGFGSYLLVTARPAGSAGAH